MTPDIPNSPQMPMPTLQDGLNGLWKLQLRREHAALLEKANAHTKRLEQLVAATNQNKKDFDERMAVLETTILNLQSEERKDRHAFEQYAEEMAMLKSQMGIVIDKLDTHDQRLNEVQLAQAASPNNGTSSFQKEHTHITEAVETPLRIPGTTASMKPTFQQVSSSTKTFNHVPESEPAPVPNAGFHSSTHTANTTTDFVGPVTHNRSRSRTRSMSMEAPARNEPSVQTTAAASRPKAPTPTPTQFTPVSQVAKLPRLSQATGTLKNYLTKANTAFGALPSPKERKFEIEFIAAFIKGMTDADKREILVEELQQEHQSRTRKDGKVEILCEWNDVVEIMKTAGLLTIGDVGSGPKHKSHKSKLQKELQGLLHS